MFHKKVLYCLSKAGKIIMRKKCKKCDCKHDIFETSKNICKNITNENFENLYKELKEILEKNYTQYTILYSKQEIYLADDASEDIAIKFIIQNYNLSEVSDLALQVAHRVNNVKTIYTNFLNLKNLSTNFGYHPFPININFFKKTLDYQIVKSDTINKTNIKYKMLDINSFKQKIFDIYEGY